jgi:hypothetical protein
MILILSSFVLARRPTSYGARKSKHNSQGLYHSNIPLSVESEFNSQNYLEVLAMSLPESLFAMDDSYPDSEPFDKSRRTRPRSSQFDCIVVDIENGSFFVWAVLIRCS